MAVTIDELQIEIQASSKSAADGIDALAESLKKLKSAVNVKGIEKLKTAFTELQSAISPLSAMIGTKLSSVAKGMADLANAPKISAATIKNIKMLAKAGKELADIDFSALSKVSNALSDIGVGSGSGASLPPVDIPVPDVGGSAVVPEIVDITSEVERAGGALRRFSDWLKQSWGRLLDVKQAARGANEKIRETGDNAKRSAGGLGKFVSSLKRILMYRVVRSILSNISSAAKEGIQNLVLYSKAIGGIDASRANATMSQFASISMQVKNSLGAALMPVLNSLMPVIQTLANWFIIAANAVNQFFAAISGASTWTRAKAAVVGYGKGLGGAAGAANDLKNAMLGIDELNVISPDSGGGGGGGGGGGIDYGDMFEEVPISQTLADLALKIKDIFFDWEDLTLNDIIDKIVVGLGMVTGAFIGWKLGGPVGAIIGTIAGAALAMYFTEFLPDFESLSSKDIQDLIVAGIGGIIGGIVGWKFGGLTGALIGFSIGASITLVLENLKWDDMSTGEKIGTVAAVLGGLVLSLGAIAKLKGLSDAGKAAEAAKTIDTAVGKLSPNLSSLAKNLGVGLVIIAEVAAAAILITGAVWVLGKELEQVGLAWQPVIDNGGTVAAAMGIGVGILAAIGVVTALLGSVGTPLIVNIALGTAILAELGIAAGLFLVEIWAIGKGLDEIGKAWQPVLDNGETIATAIGRGTALLVGIGAVTALLGAATIATGILLPAAIGLGTALLVELAVALVLFIESMVSVATELSDNLAPALSTLNEKLPDLSTNMTNFTTYMSTFADNVVDYSKSTKVAGLQATIDTIIGWFTVDPFQKLSDEVSTMNTRATTLNTNFDLANPALETACTNLGTYTTNIESIATATNVAITWPEEMFSGVKPEMIGDFSYWQVSPVGTKTIDLNTNMDKALPAMASAVLNIASYGLYIAMIALMTSSVISFPDTMFDGVKAGTIGTFAGEVSTLYTKTNTLNSNMDLALPALETASTNIATYATDIGALVTAADAEITWPTTMFAEVKSSTITKLASAVNNMQVETSRLNGKLKLAVPELEKAVGLLRSYTSFLKQMEALCGSGGTASLSSGVFINMKEVGSKLVTGFVDGIRSKSFDFTNAAKTLIDGFRNTITSYSETCKSSFSAWSANVKNWFISPSYGAINRTTFSNYAKDVIGGFNNGINANYGSVKSVMVTFASAAKNAFTGIMSRNAFYDIAKDVIKGFNNGINDFYNLSRPYMRKWANDAKKTFKKKLDSNSPSKVFERIGGDTVLGYNLGIATLGKTTRGVVNTWADSFTSVSPVMSFAVDTSALRYYSSDSFAKSVSADVTSNRTVAVTGNSYVAATGFKEGMEEFYREYIEPTMSQMAEDMRRQADKKEQTIVQVGNRTVTDAVTTQQNANGYVFAR